MLAAWPMVPGSLVVEPCVHLEYRRKQGLNSGKIGGGVGRRGGVRNS